MTPSQPLTLVLDATFTPSLINETLPAVLGELAADVDHLVVFTSDACRDALQPGVVPAGLTLRSFPNYYGNPRVELEAVLLGRERRVARVVALNEFDLLRAARVREQLGLPGMGRDSVARFRDKLAMKQAARHHGIATAGFLPVDAASDLLRAADVFGWPFIVKPRRKAGGIGFRVMHAVTDLQAFLASIEATTGWDEPLDLIAEEFVGTRMFHADGVWLGDGFACFLANEYLGLKPHHEFDPARDRYPLSGSVSVRADDRHQAGRHAALKSMTRQLLEAFGDGSPCAFHAEIWERDGQLLLNEIACRTGGGQVYEMQKEVFGISPDRITLRAQAGQRLDVADRLPHEVLVARIPPIAGVFAGLAGALPPGVRVEWALEPGQRLAEPASWVDSVGFVVCHGEDREAVVARYEQFMQHFAAAMRQPV